MTAAQPKVLMGQLPREWNTAAKSITFCVTEACNLACKYCYMTGKNHNKRLSFETAKKAVDYILRSRDEFPNEAVVWEFVGGEPFLEIALIDRICDYIKQQMFLLQHPWFEAYRFNFSTNGLLYGTPEVQKYIWKNSGHVSIGISIDGNKRKHDLQRVRVDGSGSFDSVVKNVPLWLSQFPGAATKATFSHDDLPHLKDSITTLWTLGIKMVAANLVFEDVWQDGDDSIFEDQLRQLADAIIENKWYNDYSVRFFDPTIGNPLTQEDLNRNYCGAGRMLAIDCDGNFYPCLRFYPISLARKPGLKIGDVECGIDHDRLRPFEALTLRSQSTRECIECEVGKGCAWCSACNYDCADTNTIFQRATYLCRMHKANVRANTYFWDRFEEVTGMPSEKARARESAKYSAEDHNKQRYMLILTADDITPHCRYRNRRQLSSRMTAETFENSISFCRDQGFEPIVLGRWDGAHAYLSMTDTASEAVSGDSVVIFDNGVANAAAGGSNCILLVRPSNLDQLASFLETLIPYKQRINIILEDLETWNGKELDRYRTALDGIADRTKEVYERGQRVEINVLTDLWDVKSMNNCDAGETSFCVAPDGKIYYCPAFYFDWPDESVGSVDTGLKVKNPQLLAVQNCSICHSCSAYSCQRCKFLNKKLTGEISVPSKMQCLVSQLEKRVSLKLRDRIFGESGDDPLEAIKAAQASTLC